MSEVTINREDSDFVNDAGKTVHVAQVSVTNRKGLYPFEDGILARDTSMRRVNTAVAHFLRTTRSKVRSKEGSL